MTPYRKKLIEVALPLEDINKESAREKSIRHGHPSTLHLWWARRPLAACRAVLFGQLVDDPSAWPNLFPSDADQDRERERIFRIIRQLVLWKNSNNDTVINAARLEIARSFARGRKADGEADARDEAVLAADPRPKDVDAYLAEVVPPVLDPFCGGGSIPLEAQRLGLRAHASDLNPVAVLITKALIEIPPKFAGRPPVNPEWGERAHLRQWKGAQGLAEDVRYYGRWMRDEAEKRIGHLYPKVRVSEEMARGRADLRSCVGQELTVIAWLWARTVASPNPACGGAHVPLVSSFWLSKKKGKETWIEPVVDRGSNTYRFEVRTGKPEDPEAIGKGTKLGRGANFGCLLSGDPIPEKHVKAEASAGRMGARLMAVVAEGQRRRIYLDPRGEHEDVASSASPTWAPEQSLPNNPRWFSPPAYGLTTFADLFTPRQLVALTTFSDLVGEAREKALVDARAAGLPDDNVGLEDGGTGARGYSGAVSVHLSFAVDKMLDTNTSLCTWQNKPPRLRATFGRQALPMTWDFAESNVFGGAAGDYRWCIRTQVEAMGSIPGGAQAIVEQRDAADLATRSSMLVSTDPPYYDNIGYADLSDFFYVWLRRSLRMEFPSLFGTVLVPKAQELVATPYRFDGNRERAQHHFEAGLRTAFTAACRFQSWDIPASVYYAFKQAEGRGSGNGGPVASTGWETMLAGLLHAGFSIHGTWPVRTEWGTRIVGKGTNALASSIVLVCRKRPADAPTITRTDFRRLLRAELPAALRALQHGHIAPVDMAQASIGPGMAIFSRYSRVLEPDGSPMAVRRALELINQALDEFLTEQESEVDPDTRFAVTWFETRGFEAGAYGEAETLASARNVSVQGVAESGILHSTGGKVRLLTREELPDDWVPTGDTRVPIWEATQHLIKRLEGAGEAAGADLLRALGAKGDACRDLAYRLYTACERRKWAEEARGYNALVVAWPEIARLAAEGPKERSEQEEAFDG